MIELLHVETPAVFSNASRAHPPEFSELELRRLAMNQVDYGMVVVDVDSRVVEHANTRGMQLLEPAPDASNTQPIEALYLAHRQLTAHRPVDAEQLRVALARTRNGVRSLLCLGRGDNGCTVAVVPLSSAHALSCTPAPATTRSGTNPACYALLLFSKQQVCDESTMALFARACGLTNAEGQVLAQVCRGLRPAQIASHHGVRMSTVRTQLRNIRVKTCCKTIGEVVQRMAVLPPLARHLARCA